MVGWLMADGGGYLYQSSFNEWMLMFKVALSQSTIAEKEEPIGRKVSKVVFEAA